jgi:hypothetical protein
MKNLVIDNKFLNTIAEGMEQLIDAMQDDIALLKDKNGDIFYRYMAFHRCAALVSVAMPLKDIVKNSMCGGHGLQNEIFHTESAKQNGWDKETSENHPFFKQESDDKDDDESTDIFSKIISTAILNSIIGKKKKK